MTSDKKLSPSTGGGRVTRGTERHVPQSHAALITLRRKQRLALGDLEVGAAFWVQSGCLTVDAVLSGARRQIMRVLYPGDVCGPEMTPAGLDVGLTAVVPSRVLRVRNGNAQSRPGSDLPSIDVEAAFARLLVRSGLHALMIGRLSGEERLATVLIEVAVLVGRPVPGGYSFELPLRRDDLADYLALNRDTLSRLLSRLKARNIITMPKRGWVIIKDFQSLAALTPLAEAAQKLVPAAGPAGSAPGANAASS